MNRLVALFCVLVASLAAPMAVAVTVTQTYSGAGLKFYGEVKSNGAPIPPTQQQFAAKFANAKTVLISITYDTNQPDTYADPAVGVYKIGTISIAIPELGLTASRSSSSMLISVTGAMGGSLGGIIAFANGIDTFSNSVGLPRPVTIDASLNSGSVLTGDRLPPSPYPWDYGQFFLGFAASDGSVHIVVFNFSTPNGCVLTADPPTLPDGGGSVRLSATCSGGSTPTGYSYNWAAAPPVSDLTALTYDGSQRVTVKQSTTFTVTPVNHVGPGNAAQTTVWLKPIAVEYRYPAWDHYFVTSKPSDIYALDSGAFPEFVRTGQTFEVWAEPGANRAATCRFFSVGFAPKSSHFYTPFDIECANVKSDPNWQYEEIAFYLELPLSDGTCRSGTTVLYRLYNNFAGGAPNHRYTTNQATFNQMIGLGWTFEGNAATGAFACVPTQM